MIRIFKRYDIFKGGPGSGNFGHGGRPGRQGGSGQGGGGQGGREYITIMHGTREGVIDSILENGILPSKPIPRGNTSVRELRDQPTGVYVSTEFNDASWWAAFSRRPGEDTLVFEAKIDKSLLNADPLKKGRFFTKDKILPDKLQAVSFIKSRVIREGYRTRVEGKITRKLIVNGKVEKIDNLTNEIIVFCPVVFTTTVEKVDI